MAAAAAVEVYCGAAVADFLLMAAAVDDVIVQAASTDYCCCSFVSVSYGGRRGDFWGSCAS